MARLPAPLQVHPRPSLNSLAWLADHRGANPAARRRHHHPRQHRRGPSPRSSGPRRSVVRRARRSNRGNRLTYCGSGSISGTIVPGSALSPSGCASGTVNGCLRLRVRRLPASSALLRFSCGQSRGAVARLGRHLRRRFGAAQGSRRRDFGTTCGSAEVRPGAG
jgi:hypothetical protein